jgi:hypothetical protein
MSVTTYWCQIFLLPKKVIKVVNSICRSFLWHYDDLSRKAGSVNWDDLCKLKKEGGLGIRNLKAWNLTAFGKTAWHVSHMHESL